VKGRESFMGYDVHITRKTHWVDEAGPEIPLEEWESYADSDPMLSVNGHVTWNIDGNLVRARIFDVREPGSRDEIAAALYWYCGNVSSKNPCRAGVAHMASIAARLNARVQGDDGEFYDERGDPIREQGAPA
jgi:hypothetical protein